MPLSRQRSSVRRPVSTGVALGALLAIPVVSVSSVALVADIASSTDGSRVFVGVAALLCGLVAGALSRRVLGSLRHQARLVTLSVLDMIGRLTSVVAVRVSAVRWSPDRQPAAAALVFVPSDVGRRGPPRSAR